MTRKTLSLTTIGCITFMLLNSPIVSSSENLRSEPNRVGVSLPSHYPSHFPKLGVLNQKRSQYDWIVDGVSIKVSSNVLVHSLVTNFSSLYSVKQGSEMAYRKNSQGEIAELWLLPDGSVDKN